MQYQRTFRFSSSHLNSMKAYEVVWSLADKVIDDHEYTPQEILDAMRATHGHNYRVVVWIEGQLRNDNPWLIDDEALGHVMKEYENTNLSLLPFFLANKKRATTEELALLMWGNLNVVTMENECTVIRIEVWETDDVCAVFEPPYAPR